MQQLSVRDQKIVLDRAAGATYEAAGEKHGLSAQRAYTLVRRATDFLNKLELDLLVARKTDEAVAYVVPYQDQSDRAVALDFLEWVRRSLERRDVKVKVERRGTTEGEVFFLFDVTPIGDQE